MCSSDLGMRDADLDWAARTLMQQINGTVLGAGKDAERQRPSLQISYLDPTLAFHRRTLCHKDVWRVQERGFWGGLKGPSSWRASGAVDSSEWVTEINIINLGETFQQESMHPNYWGQLALRSCWRQAWNGGDIRGGACQRDYEGGLNSRDEPNMKLAGDPAAFRIN